MNTGKSNIGYEGLYECLSAVTLPKGTLARTGDLAVESDFRGNESCFLKQGSVRLVGYVRRGSRLD
ncbi:hypothetical protein BH11ARM2_BH11ARM2_28180 [soil metagenome]